MLVEYGHVVGKLDLMRAGWLLVVVELVFVVAELAVIARVRLEQKSVVARLAAVAVEELDLWPTDLDGTVVEFENWKLGWWSPPVAVRIDLLHLLAVERLHVLL